MDLEHCWMAHLSHRFANLNMKNTKVLNSASLSFIFKLPLHYPPPTSHPRPSSTSPNLAISLKVFVKSGPGDYKGITITVRVHMDGNG